MAQPLLHVYEEERGWRFTEEFSAFACIPQYADGPAGKKKSCIRAAAVRTQDHKKIGVARLELAASCSQIVKGTCYGAFIRSILYRIIVTFVLSRSFPSLCILREQGKNKAHSGAKQIL